MEAASTEEIGEWLSGLFFWRQVKCHVGALQSITSTIEREREVRKLLELRKGREAASFRMRLEGDPFF
jgi:hypothetical protein